MSGQMNKRTVEQRTADWFSQRSTLFYAFEAVLEAK
jgi:hypothetical protein